ncbi:MAG: substrate-binding domain-containing protein [Muribaculaceae bacterium]|nr:substrate-binding domain-containing protein [Muribaculaceae bacterium]
MKLFKQIAVLTLIAALFVTFDLYVYFTCTRRLQGSGGLEKKTSSIEVADYLPFDENSLIVNIKADLPLEGELPVIDGAEGLYPVYSAFVNAVYPENSVIFDGENFAPESKLQMRNTLKAYSGVVDGTADIAVCAAPSEEQLAYAAEKGVELEFVPIGRDAFVFLVNAKNPVDGLTAEQIRGIYGGRYKNWSELGGEDIPINPVQRLAGSGSQSAFLKFMDGVPAEKNYNAYRGSPIGFSFRFYTTGMRGNDGVKMLSVDGAYPDVQSVSSGEYPISAEFYAVYNKENPNPNVSVLIDWFLSESGQKIVEDTGYVPIK